MAPRFSSVILACVLLLASMPVQAAQVYFGVPTSAVLPGAVLEVGVFLNSDGETVNATEGSVQFPKDMFQLQDVRSAGSVVSLWMTQPSVAEAGTVSFAGMIPGGFRGERGYLFSLVLLATGSGTGTVMTNGIRVLLHDGQGTEAKLRSAPLSITVGPGGRDPAFLPPMDQDPPEPFALVPASDPNVFGGAPFVAFSAQDKGSGIARYEVWEGPPADSIRSFFSRKHWRLAESPYQIEDSSGRTRVLVRAVDRLGNERVAELASRVPAPVYERTFVWGILSVFLVALAAIRILWGRNKRSRVSHSSAASSKRF